MPAADRPDPLAPLAELPAVRDSVAEARVAVDVLLARWRARRTGHALGLELALEAALGAARLQVASEGTAQALPSGTDDLRAVLVAKLARQRRSATGAGPPSRTGAEDLDDFPPVLAGAVRVFTEIPDLLSVWARAPLQALARLHVLASSRSPAPGSVGRPRTADSCAPEVAGLPAAPPAHLAVDRLRAVAELALFPSSVPAIVTAAVAHGELLVVRAFPDANVVLALAAQRLVLMEKGLDPEGLLGVESALAEAGYEEYASAAADYTTGAPGGVARWIRSNAQAVLSAAVAGVSRMTVA